MIHIPLPFLRGYKFVLVKAEGGVFSHPALSGLAHEYKQHTGDSYLAGIWSSSIVDHLCWCVPSSNSDYQVTRSTSYRAPSWSWACLDGGVIFDKGSYGEKLDVKDYSIKVKGRDSLGQVESASISIEAKLDQQHWKRRWDRKWYYACPSSRLSGLLLHDSQLRPYTTATLVLDTPISDSDELEIWSLPLRKQFALALQPVNEEQTIFKRIGAIVWRSTLDDGALCVKRLITII